MDKPELDQGMIDALSTHMDDFHKYQELVKWEAETWAELEAQFKHVYRKKLEEKYRLEARLKSLKDALQMYVEDRIMQGGEDRRSFVRNLVRVQVRKRIAEGWDEGEVKKWAEEYNYMGLPKDGTSIIEYLLKHNRDLLVPDVQSALKAALMMTDGGHPIYSDHPADIEEYVTQISDETFTKVMSTLALELAFDARTSQPEE